MGLLDLCKKFYGKDDLYEILGISENATDKEVKKAYHKLSLQVHPDRVEEDDKLEATEKFKILGNIHAVLSDKDRRALYDETKCVEDDDSSQNITRDWSDYWRVLFKKITEEDIKNYEKEYIGSQEEKDDLKQAYLRRKGDMNYIMDEVQFATSKQEPRLRELLQKMIEDGEIPSYRKFTHEPEKKRKRRLAKENREAQEVENLKNLLGLSSDNSLDVMIRQRQESRVQKMDSFLDDLAAKYGGDNKKGTKRKAAPKGETTTKNKKKKK